MTEKPECPRCGSPMVEKTAPFYMHGEYVGSFESVVCEICNCSLLTSVGYDKAMIQARKFGLVGPEEDVIKESVEMFESSYILEKIMTSSNVKGEFQNFSISGEKLDAHAMTTSGELASVYKYTNKQPYKTTQILAISKKQE